MFYINVTYYLYLERVLCNTLSDMNKYIYYEEKTERETNRLKKKKGFSIKRLSQVFGASSIFFSLICFIGIFCNLAIILLYCTNKKVSPGLLYEQNICQGFLDHFNLSFQEISENSFYLQNSAMNSRSEYWFRNKVFRRNSYIIDCFM